MSLRLLVFWLRWGSWRIAGTQRLLKLIVQLQIIIKFGIWEFHSDDNTKIYAYEANLINQINILQEFEKTIYPIRNLYDYSYIDLRTKNQVIVKEKYGKGKNG